MSEYWKKYEIDLGEQGDMLDDQLSLTGSAISTSPILGSSHWNLMTPECSLLQHINATYCYLQGLSLPWVSILVMTCLKSWEICWICTKIILKKIFIIHNLFMNESIKYTHFTYNRSAIKIYFYKTFTNKKS